MRIISYSGKGLFFCVPQSLSGVLCGVLSNATEAKEGNGVILEGVNGIYDPLITEIESFLFRIWYLEIILLMMIHIFCSSESL